MPALPPVQTNEREIFMDVPGGFAILGIFIANPGTGFSGYGQSVFIVQIIICSIWLKYFNYGPVEWIWRSATYKKWEPFVKNELTQ